MSLGKQQTRTVYSESFLFEILLGKKNFVKKKNYLYGSFFSGSKALQAFLLLISRHIYTYISSFIQGNLINFLLCSRTVERFMSDQRTLFRRGGT